MTTHPRFIKEGHTSDTASLKVSVDELKSGFSNLEDAFKKVHITLVVLLKTLIVPS